MPRQFIQFVRIRLASIGQIKDHMASGYYIKIVKLGNVINVVRIKLCGLNIALIVGQRWTEVLTMTNKEAEAYDRQMKLMLNGEEINQEGTK